IAEHVMPIRRYEPLNRRVSTTMNGLATDFLSGYHYEARVARTVSPGRRASHRRPRCVLSPDGHGVDRLDALLVSVLASAVSAMIGMVVLAIQRRRRPRTR